MSQDSEIVPVSVRSRACITAFEQCLSKASHQSVSVRQYSNIEDQMARFSVWTSNMAVFAAGKACLDHRLREAKDVHGLILGMLEALQARILECETHISLLPVTQDQSSQASSPTHWHDGLDKITAALSSQVGLFHEISNVIRRASRQSQNDRAATSFCIKDEEGNNLEAALKNFFMHNLQDRFPESSSEICERLAVTMILRRKRILYRRARYPIMPIKPTDPASKPQLMIHPLATGATSTVKSATTLDPEKFRRASAPSTVSSNQYINVDSHEELVFPPRPATLRSHMTETPVTCPFCLYVLKNPEIQDETKWKKHVLADLDPLVCLFDSCDQPDVLYSHTKDWLRHMRKHTERWQCTTKSHGLFDFATFEDFMLHMKIDHMKSYTESQVSLLAERGVQTNGPLFPVCPLCKKAFEGNNMIAHILGHLRSLALKSLPRTDGEDEDSMVDDEDHSRQSRSTTRELERDQDDSNTSEFPWGQNPEGLSRELDVPQTNESTEEIWSNVRSMVQPGKTLPTLGDPDDPIILALASSQSKEKAPETSQKPGQVVESIIPPTNIPPMQNPYHFSTDPGDNYDSGPDSIHTSPSTPPSTGSTVLLHNSEYILPCEFVGYDSCDQYFYPVDADQWMNHIIIDHLQNELPNKSNCWFCDSISFDARRDRTDKASSFRNRLNHIRFHIRDDHVGIRNMRPDYDFVRHIWKRRLISRNVYEAARGWREGPVSNVMDFTFDFTPEELSQKPEQSQRTVNDEPREESKRHGARESQREPQSHPNEDGGLLSTSPEKDVTVTEEASHDGSKRFGDHETESTSRDRE